MHLLLMPGLDGTGRLFQPLINLLAKNLLCTTIGYSNIQPQSYDQLADYAMSKIPAGDTILVAESFSGYVAYKVSQRQPASVKGIVFVATFLTPPKVWLLKSLCHLPVHLLFRLHVPRFIIKAMCLGPNIKEEILRLLYYALDSVDPKVMASRLRQIISMPAATAPLRVPACYIRASHDRLIPRESIHAFFRLIPDIPVYTVPGPHLILQANPKECCHALYDFLQKL